MVRWIGLIVTKFNPHPVQVRTQGDRCHIIKSRRWVRGAEDRVIKFEVSLTNEAFGRFMGLTVAWVGWRIGWGGEVSPAIDESDKFNLGFVTTCGPTGD